MQKPTEPGHGKLLVLGSTGSKKTIGAGQIELCLGTCLQRRLASRLELSAHTGNVADWVEMLVVGREQVQGFGALLPVSRARGHCRMPAREVSITSSDFFGLASSTQSMRGSRLLALEGRSAGAPWPAGENRDRQRDDPVAGCGEISRWPPP
jgi:hypothetical protein